MSKFTCTDDGTITYNGHEPIDVTLSIKNGKDVLITDIEPNNVIKVDKDKPYRVRQVTTPLNITKMALKEAGRVIDSGYLAIETGDRITVKLPESRVYTK